MVIEESTAGSSSDIGHELMDCAPLTSGSHVELGVMCLVGGPISSTYVDVWPAQSFMHGIPASQQGHMLVGLTHGMPTGAMPLMSTQCDQRHGWLILCVIDAGWRGSWRGHEQSTQASQGP